MNTFEILHIDFVLSKLNNYSRSSSIPEHPEVMMGAFNPSFDSEDDFWDLSGSFAYTYDEAGQLTSACDETGEEYRFVYDNTGNIRLVQHSEDGDSFENSKTFTYNANGLLTGYIKDGSNYICYTLDGMGSPVRITVREGSPSGAILSQKTLSWGEGRMLTGIQEDSNNYVTYTYNQDGLRTRKTVCKNGVSYVTDYIWNDGVLVAEKTEDQTITILYGEDGAAEGFVVECNEYGEPEFQQYAYLKNLQGDVTHIISVDDDTVITSYVYDPWGNPTVFGDEEIAAINPCSYRGYYFDEETGWYYLQSRYYNPEAGRFLNADDTSLLPMNRSLSGNNVYAYCNNNPVNFSDENGYFSFKVYAVAAITSAVISAIAKIISNYTKGYRGKQLFKGVVGASVGSAVNTILCLKFIKQENGIVIAAFFAGAVQAVFDFLEDALVTKKYSWSKLTKDFIINSATNLAGNYLGGKAVYINKGWIQPTKISSFLKKSYGQKIIAQTGIGSAVGTLVDIIKDKLGKIAKAIRG